MTYPYAGRHTRPRVTLIIDPRFSGGTSSAVAQELHTISQHVEISVHAVSSKMFKGNTINTRLQAALDHLGIPVIWDAPVIRGDVVVLHNPSFLKFNTHFKPKITCETLICVTHENVLTPQGLEGFDMGACLDMIEKASVCGARYLAPVSESNRQGVVSWLTASSRSWGVTPFNWFNICDFEIQDPTYAPQDRRGRMSRPGWEKFPDMATMMQHFPEHAHNRIMGANSYLETPSLIPAHWDVMPFGAEAVNDFLTTIDFFVYFTNDRWRESFGRVIAEAIAAGKMVITDVDTGSNFAGAVVISDRNGVNDVINAYIADPEAYVKFVCQAQTQLSRFGKEAFLETALKGALTLPRGTHDIF